MRRTVAAGSKLEMRYRRAIDTDWKVGHPLLWINPAWVASGAPQAPVDSFAGQYLRSHARYRVRRGADAERAGSGCADVDRTEHDARASVWGGPLYCFRNIIVNTMRGPLKLNNTNSGFLIYSNTIVRTTGTTDWGWVQFNNGDLRNWAYRNNLSPCAALGREAAVIIERGILLVLLIEVLG